MATQNISIDFPSDILLALNASETDLKEQIKFTLAVEFYRSDKLSIGKAAQLAGLSRLEFEKKISKQGISISNLNEKDIFNDIEKLK